MITMTQSLTLALILLALLAASLSLQHRPEPAVAELVLPRVSEVQKNQAFPAPLPDFMLRAAPVAFDI